MPEDDVEVTGGNFEGGPLIQGGPIQLWFPLTSKLELIGIEPPEDFVIFKQIIITDPDGDYTVNYYSLMLNEEEEEEEEEEEDTLQEEGQGVKVKIVDDGDNDSDIIIPKTLYNSLFKLDKRVLIVNLDKEIIKALPGQDPIQEGRWITLRDGRRIFIRGKVTGTEKEVSEALGVIKDLPKAFGDSIEGGVQVHKGPQIRSIASAVAGSALLVTAASLIMGAVRMRVINNATTGKIGLGVVVDKPSVAALWGSLGARGVYASIAGLGILGTYDPNKKGIDLYPNTTRAVGGLPKPVRWLVGDKGTTKDVVNHEAAHALYFKMKEDKARGGGRELINKFTDSSIKERAVTRYAGSYQTWPSFLFGRGTRFFNRLYSAENFAEMHMLYRRGDLTKSVIERRPQSAAAFFAILNSQHAL
jgi:hypothetical protein